MTAMSNEDLAARIAALEERMDIQEGLRASQDRDLASLEQRTKAIVTLVQATALTVGEHSEDLRSLRSDMRLVRASQLEHSSLLAEIITRLERLAPGSN